jgi:hypothetical protein
MVFQVPESKANDNLFEFSIPGSEKVWALPKLQYLRASQAEELTGVTAKIRRVGAEKAKKDPALVGEISDIQRKIVEQYCPGLYDLVTNDQLGALMEAWQEASTVSLGESSPSSSKSKTTAKK